MTTSTAPLVIDDTARPEVYCCLGCRLVQAPGRECVECAESMVAPIASLRELLSYRDMRVIERRDLGMISALLAGGSVVMPFLLPISMATFGLWLFQLPRRWQARSKAPIAAIADTRSATLPGAVTVEGQARALRGAARAPWDGRPCLAAELAVRSLGGLYLRAVARVPFVVRAADERDVVVAGVVRFAPAPVRQRLAGAARTSGDDPLLARLGVPASWRFDGRIVVQAIDDGDRVRVTGGVIEEGVAELADYRDGGVARVMRGTVDAPVVIGAAP